MRSWWPWNYNFSLIKKKKVEVPAISDAAGPEKQWTYLPRPNQVTREILCAQMLLVNHLLIYRIPVYYLHTDPSLQVLLIDATWAILHQYIQCPKTSPFHNLSRSQRLLWALGVHACSWLPDYSRYIYMHSLLTTWYCLPYRTTFYNGTDVSMWIFFHNLYRFKYKVTCWFSYSTKLKYMQSSTLWVGLLYIIIISIKNL